MASLETKAHKIYRFARNAAIDARQSSTGAQSSVEQDSILEEALAQLHKQLQVEKAKLEALQDQNVDHAIQLESDATIRLWQLKSMTAAYTQLAIEVPDLPAHGSPLPALLASRTTGQTVMDTRKVITKASKELASTRAQLMTEVARLRAYQSVAAALARRIERMQALLLARASMTPMEVFEAQLDAQANQQNLYVDEGDQLLRELTAFINDRLAPMIAAEDQGGSPVGDLLGITDETLGAGFSAKGKMKQIQTTDSAALEALTQRGRQCRLAASKTTRQLIKRLLREFENDPAIYISIQQESAASRYLIQAKIAELDPEDARRIRLINFLDNA